MVYLTFRLFSESPRASVSRSRNPGSRAGGSLIALSQYGRNLTFAGRQERRGLGYVLRWGYLMSDQTDMES